MDAPTRSDPLIRQLSDRLGGPAGRRLGDPGRGRFWTVPRILVAMTLVSILLSVLSMQHCRAHGWGGDAVYLAGCYSDVAALYSHRGFDVSAWTPFLDGGSFEYPVLTGLVASLAAVLTSGVDGAVGALAPMLDWWGERGSLLYWDVTFLGLAAAWIVLVLAVMAAAGRRRWDAAIVATSPAIILGAGINWDLWATTAMVLALLCHLRGRDLAAGALIAVGVSFKLFPLFLLGALLVLALRDDGIGLRRFGRTLAATAGVWLGLNIPAMLISWENWSEFFVFSAERGVGYSSPWYVWQLIAEANGGSGPSAELVSLAALGLFVAACAGVLVLGLAAPRRPRAAQLMLLIVAAFLLVSKVYSPQFMIWLVPLIALAAPRWRDAIIWQALEVAHFWAVWMHLAALTSDFETRHTMDDAVYVAAVLGHMAATVWIMAVVVRDMMRPEQDVVRPGQEPTAQPAAARRVASS